MIFTINEFCNYVSGDVNRFVDRVYQEAGFTVWDDEKKNIEKKNTCNSYTELSNMFTLAKEKNSKFGEAQICMINRIRFIGEYKLPSYSARCDVVLLGKGKGKKQVVIIENKNFDAKSQTDIDTYGKMWHNGHPARHPSDQVKGYVEYCRYFHSAVLEYGAMVDGCVFFSKPVDITPYKVHPIEELCNEYPLFNTDTAGQLADYILDRIEDGDEKFAKDFEDGYYKQDKNVLIQSAENMSKSCDARPLVLLDNQRYGFHSVMDILTERIKDKEGEKKKEVIIVEGPPGSGKSAIAITLWIEAVKQFGQDEGNIVYVTTSSSQTKNWQNIFKIYGGNYSAKNLIYTANNFSPPRKFIGECLSYFLNKADKEKYVKNDQKDKKKDKLGYEYYEEYVNHVLMLSKAKGIKTYKDNLHFLSIVDEAHALLNPVDDKYADGMYGWIPQMGPQAYHIIRESQVSVFLMDSEQSFRKRETTSIEDIKKLAAHFGAHITPVSLADSQFRCAGSKEYVDWVTSLFTETPLQNVNEWNELFHVELVDYPSEVDEYLQKKIDNKEKSVRLLSSFSKEWISDPLLPDHSNGKEYDFDLEDKNGARYKKYWNSEYIAFIQGGEGTVMEDDPLSEVGCPYTVRGFDYDHIGLLWLSDLVWRKGHWMINFKNVYETGINNLKNDARNEQIRLGRIIYEGSDELACANQTNAPMIKELFQSMAQAYRILLTRPIKTLCIYIEDKETREYVRSLLK